MEVLLSIGKCKQIFAFRREKEYGGQYWQAMPSYIQRHKTRHFHSIGNAWFLLVEAPPQSPQDTILYPGNAAKCSGYAIFQITYGRLTSFFFGFSFHGKRILPQNPVYICLGSLQRTHLLSGLLVIRIQSFFLGQKLSILRLQALDGGQLF